MGKLVSSEQHKVTIVASCRKTMISTGWPFLSFAQTDLENASLALHKPYEGTLAGFFLRF